MNLDEAQKKKVAAWIAEGLTLSEIQSQLAAECGLRLSYLEMRLLMDDLRLKPTDRELPKTAPPVVGSAAGETAPLVTDKPQAAAEDKTGIKETPPSGVGGVSVVVDQLARPGALVSGKVTFSDGKSADWYLDQFGRLGVVPKEQGYKPSQADIQTFQGELEKQMAKLGAL